MPDPAFNNNIVYLISSFAHHFTKLLTASFQQHALTLTAEQFSILTLLAQSDGLPQQEIGRKLERDKTTITRVLINLKKLGLVSQKGDALDTRAKNIYLTAAGKRTQEQAMQVAGFLYGQVLGNFSEKEINQNIRLLKQMNEIVKNLS